jgi:hypothetical protein
MLTDKFQQLSATDFKKKDRSLGSTSSAIGPTGKVTEDIGKGYKQLNAELTEQINEMKSSGSAVFDVYYKDVTTIDGFVNREDGYFELSDESEDVILDYCRQYKKDKSGIKSSLIERTGSLSEFGLLIISIMSEGCNHSPIFVDDKKQIIAGESRWRAVRFLHENGFEHIKLFALQKTHEDVVSLKLERFSENNDRGDLSHWSSATQIYSIYQEYLKDFDEETAAFKTQAGCHKTKNYFNRVKKLVESIDNNWMIKNSAFAVNANRDVLFEVQKALNKNLVCLDELSLIVNELKAKGRLSAAGAGAYNKKFMKELNALISPKSKSALIETKAMFSVGDSLMLSVKIKSEENNKDILSDDEFRQELVQLISKYANRN